MFSWLCTKAEPRTGTLRTSWTILAGQTRLDAQRVEKLCRGLKGKGYIAYPEHRGWRTLVQVAIDKFRCATGLTRDSRRSAVQVRRRWRRNSNMQTRENQAFRPP